MSSSLYFSRCVTKNYLKCHDEISNCHVNLISVTSQSCAQFRGLKMQLPFSDGTTKHLQLKLFCGFLQIPNFFAHEKFSIQSLNCFISSRPQLNLLMILQLLVLLNAYFLPYIVETPLTYFIRLNCRIQTLYMTIQVCYIPACGRRHFDVQRNLMAH